ncbi:hypothetical protein [Thiohalomonas denitrificans]|uniref:hypothetical protein n=1 Tax=Thiohalomonas denitrificans TaxID=415747 RepID=UPI001585E3E3|nr:hypothetical protein [Thiohalomonas denitrificans]
MTENIVHTAKHTVNAVVFMVTVIICSRDNAMTYPLVNWLKCRPELLLRDTTMVGKRIARRTKQAPRTRNTHKEVMGYNNYHLDVHQAMNRLESNRFKRNRNREFMVLPVFRLDTLI